MRKHLWWLAITLAVVFFDQLSKVLLSDYLILGQRVALFPSLNLYLIHNPGAAFSFLSDAGEWKRWLFILLSAVVSAVLVVWLRRIADSEKLNAVAMALVLGGAIGNNLIDRVLYGYVIDFIDFYYMGMDSCLPLFQPLPGGSCHWPTFNIADSAISVGAVLLLIGIFFQPGPGNGKNPK